jgi:cellulose synthase/poly-beta-1,6-N-acetylglucosamine synthase-like glycosyltransferase
MLTLSVGICAYNERENIGRILQALSVEKLEKVLLKEIIVVASGCTDDTEAIVEEFAKKNSRVILIKENERRGKAAAVNTFLKKAGADILVLISADTLPEKNAIQKLVEPLFEEDTGMTGGRPVPVNGKNTFMGFLAHFMWELHHKIALKDPKLGEMVAFKNLVKEIPSNSAVDEASIEAIIRAAGLKIKYCPEAVVYNKGPENISDLLKQRRRIFAGHLWLKETGHYSVSTMGGVKIFKLVFNNIKWTPKEFLYTMMAIKLEILGRFLGFWDYKVLKKNPAKWDIASSTKNLN